MLKMILIALVLLIAGFCVIVAMQPSEFRVSRSTSINAPGYVVFALVNNMKAWGHWSPWIEMDPQAKITFAGPEEGVGAASSWDGEKTGAGTMTVTQSIASERVEFRLDFTRPMAGTSTAEFLFSPENGRVNVTWNMYGRNNFMAKAVGLVMNCDKMVGEQFEKGLAKLKAVSESLPATSPGAPVIPAVPAK